ncbi:Ubiquitin carboxyl-terminal hydrolase 1 [Heterocephalus glaber]|uniref:Ubiquitin carboxyl-terminal hydrolase 1 n=1 Tax=Heterocephalus glaber TaxID=10181 RepID=G5BXZ6_HETGA|nr:Ubiquitin carboxyl-terminal hydrolase 1 [Heterocephalus glaber]
MPEVVTIHLKCFAASGFEFDCYSVVIHSDITISSGHYTASIKVTDLNSLELDKENFVVDQMCEVSKPEPLNEEEARGAVENYDNEEVSMRVGGNTQPSKVLNKKNVEAIGILGGQKSKADYELYNKASNPDRAASIAFAESRSSQTNSINGTHEVDRNQESSDQTGIYRRGFENKISCVVQSLKECEGKWLLFGDSEVKGTKEKDFLNSHSSSTPPTSTPYLLFYKKL